MSAKTEQILSGLTDAIKNFGTVKTAPFDSIATLIRVDDDGTAWVHFEGGVEETPVRMTINANPGDQVQVRVSNGDAFLVGNGSAPPTDDARANEAYDVADGAMANAKRAYNAAEAAEKDAARAQDAADAAQLSANSAQSSANAAQQSATTANTAANNALTQLSVVEDVVGTLNWISEHGTYTSTTDTEVVPGKLYFVRSGSGTSADPYVYSVVTTPVSNPSTAGYYELSGIDEAVSNYVATHLALTDEGLYVVSDSSGYKVHIAADKVEIIDGNGKVVNSMGEDGNVIGREDESHLNIGTDSVYAYDGKGIPFFGVDMNGANIALARHFIFGYEVNCPAADYYNYPWMCAVDISEGYNVVERATFSLNAGSGTDINWSGSFIIMTPPSQFGTMYFIPSAVTYTGPCAPNQYQFDTSTLIFNIDIQNTVGGTSFSKTCSIRIPVTGQIGGQELNAINLNLYFDYNATTNKLEYKATAQLDVAQLILFRLNPYNIALSYTSYTHAPAYFLGSAVGNLGVYSTAIGDNIYASGDRQLAFGKYNIEDEDDEYVLIAGNGTADDARSNALAVTWDGNMEMALDTAAASGTDDAALYAAITALGWGSGVIV